MPTITPISFDPRVITLSVERDAKRSPNIHLSSIIKDLLITAGIERKLTGGKKFTPEQQHLIFERGFLWERMVHEFCETNEWYKRQLDEAASRHFVSGFAETDKILVRPGECMLDNIYMTPDALNMAEYAVEEWKATGLRGYNFNIEERRPEWLWQAASYAHIFGMTKAIFRIWHVSDGMINSLMIEWTPDEIKENWKRITEHWEFMQQRKLQ